MTDDIEEVTHGEACALKCDPMVFKKGEPIALLNAGAHHAENWVRRVRKASGQQVDWHYSGGIAQVLFLGDREKVLAAVLKYQNHSPDVRVMRICEEETGLYRAGVSDAPEGAIASYMDPLSGTQSFIVKK